MGRVVEGAFNSMADGLGDTPPKSVQDLSHGPTARPRTKSVNGDKTTLGDGVSVLDTGRRIAIGGDSAGAYLAAACAASVETDHPGAIKAQLFLYPLLQLDRSMWATSLLKEARTVGWAAARYINAQLMDAGESAPSLLSLSQLALSPSVVAAGGSLNPCKADALALADMLRDAGREVIWRNYPTLVHGFGNLTHVSARAREAVAEIGSLIGGILTRDPPV